MTQTSMFYGAPPAIFEKAKMLRKNMTPEELLLWNVVKENKIHGLRFKPQHPINVYIADFYCHKLKLVIEIDGENHETPNQKEYDQSRTRILNGFDIDVIRFTNTEIRHNLNSVIKKLTEECRLRIDHQRLNK